MKKQQQKLYRDFLDDQIKYRQSNSKEPSRSSSVDKKENNNHLHLNQNINSSSGMNKQNLNYNSNHNHNLLENASSDRRIIFNYLNIILF